MCIFPTVGRVRSVLGAETTHQIRPNPASTKIGRKDPGRNDPAETTQGRNDQDSCIVVIRLLCCEFVINHTTAEHQLVYSLLP